jgi:citryl-CoA lyase
MSHWKTSISEIGPGSIRVRGYDIADLMDRLSFAEAVFLVLRGELPTVAEATVMNAILVSCIDHGPTPPSVLATRTVVSGGNPLNAALAAGVLAIGDAHGGAIEQSAMILQQWATKDGSVETLAQQLADWLNAAGQRMPGFGHLLHSVDPRTVRLFELADQLSIAGRHTALCRALHAVLSRTTSRPLPINIDGAIAAVVSDMGFDWRVGKGLFILSRMPGLIAHAHEEMAREKPLRTLGPMPFEYDGPPERKLPE